VLVRLKRWWDVDGVGNIRNVGVLKCFWGMLGMLRVLGMLGMWRDVGVKMLRDVVVEGG
jgi:hypothetical protein